jgi:uncharacterized DUF497 family protein
VIDFENITGFDWDDGNRQKNLEKHQVATGECEEVFFNLPLLLQDDPRHSQREPRFYVLGHSNAGRLLFIAFTVRKDKIRVVSTRDMSRKERAFYEQENS